MKCFVMEYYPVILLGGSSCHHGTLGGSSCHHGTLGGSPCHHGMARPRVGDGRDGLQLEVSCEYTE
jgi:hypothetical protein